MPLAFDTAGPVTQRALWFGLLGGAVAWTLHLLASWAVAEFGCVMARSGGSVTTTVVLLVAVSLVCLAGAVVATVIAYRSLGRLRDQSDDNERFMARAGLVTSGLFAFIVAVESVPILFFLSHC